MGVSKRNSLHLNTKIQFQAILMFRQNLTVFPYPGLELFPQAKSQTVLVLQDLITTIN